VRAEGARRPQIQPRRPGTPGANNSGPAGSPEAPLPLRPLVPTAARRPETKAGRANWPRRLFASHLASPGGSGGAVKFARRFRAAVLVGHFLAGPPACRQHHCCCCFLFDLSPIERTVASGLALRVVGAQLVAVRQQQWRQLGATTNSSMQARHTGTGRTRMMNGEGQDRFWSARA
jgi:hypothetical protein